jgi:hypothetical protein
MELNTTHCMGHKCNWSSNPKTVVWPIRWSIHSHSQTDKTCSRYVRFQPFTPNKYWFLIQHSLRRLQYTQQIPFFSIPDSIPSPFVHWHNGAICNHWLIHNILYIICRNVYNTSSYKDSYLKPQWSFSYLKAKQNSFVWLPYCFMLWK